MAKLDAMGHRWITSLGPYHFDLHYKTSKKNLADPLSRINWSSIESHMVKATFDLAQIDQTGIVHVKEPEGQTCINKSLRAGKGACTWKIRQKEDPTIRKAKALVKKFKFDTYKVDPNEKEKFRHMLKMEKTS